MNRTVITFIIITFIYIGCTSKSLEYQGLDAEVIKAEGNSVTDEIFGYHNIIVDGKGDILPWYSTDLGESYDHVIKLVWEFWNNMEVDINGMKYYLNHQVWSKVTDDPADKTTRIMFPDADHDMRGLGGDQLNMALSSWNLLYNYMGDEEILENMIYIADHYLANSLSPNDSEWPNLPYPYNTGIHEGRYNGDMILGRDFLQPDKAGSFGYELLTLYKKTGDEKYLSAAVDIANTLANKVQTGNEDHSPWPFKVNAITGEVGILTSDEFWHPDIIDRPPTGDLSSSYTTNWPHTLMLFQELKELDSGDVQAYQRAFDMVVEWMKTYPVKTNKWGPFFEDIPGWSDTSINSISYGMFLMDNRHLDPDWKETVRGILKWNYEELGNTDYIRFGVIPINEQTRYRVPGNSHSSRVSSMELRYWELTGEADFYVRNAIRKLNWATYTVDVDGKNRYPFDQIWMTDSYGDYVRHYLRSMAAAPQLAPSNADRMLRTSSVVQTIRYQTDSISYITFDPVSEELFRLISKPKSVIVNGQELQETTDLNASTGWIWQSLDQGGVLSVRHDGTEVQISK